MRPYILVSALAAAGVVVAGAIALLDRSPDDDHAHAEDALAHLHSAPTAFGEPGDPHRPSRIVEVAMRELHDGRMLFVPDVISVRVGEQILFVVKNEGDFAHEMVIATLRENLQHAEEMKRNPDMQHDDPNAIRLGATEKGELVWLFSKAGEFDFSCLVPGHREAGMHGRLVVR